MLDIQICSLKKSDFSSGVYFIETKVFQTTANFYPEMFVLGPLLGLVVISGICLYLINGIVKKSPKELFN